jgi:hypothetical protein
MKSNFFDATYCRMPQSVYYSHCPGRRGLSIESGEDVRMSMAVHHNSELGKVALAIIGIVAFVMVALTWVPELMAPQGGPGGSDSGSTVRMIR